jgi:2-iminobutanoate/2-iminopropanoate deaminase
VSATEDARVLRTSGAPAAIGPYAQGRAGILAGRWIITSGQVGLDPATGVLASGGIKAETERALENLKAVLGAGGAGFGDVVKTTVFLADMDEFGAMNEVYARVFPDPKPARSTVAVLRLPRDARVEIEAWAFLP